MKSKWFKFEGEMFESKRQAITIKEAWDKTFKKWQLLMEGYSIGNHTATCGLCGYYGQGCRECPILIATGTTSCLTFREQPDLEYLFLLIVKEATYKRKKQ